MPTSPQSPTEKRQYGQYSLILYSRPCGSADSTDTSPALWRHEGPAGTLLGMRTTPAALAILALWIGCAHGPKLPETGTLEGKVVDELGRAVDSARVYLVGVRDVRFTTADGAFQFAGLYAGVYAVSVTTPSLHSRFKNDIKVNPGRVTEVQLTLIAPPPEETRMGFIRGKVVSEDKSEVEPRGGAVFALGAQRGGTIDSTGHFMILLPIGTYTLRARCPGYKQADRDGVHVSEDDTTRVDFKLVPAPYRIPPIHLRDPRRKTR